MAATATGACNTADLKQAPGSSSGTSGTAEPPCEVDCETPEADGGRPPPADGEAPVVPTSEAVTIQVQPGPGTSGPQVESAIRGAKTSVHMTMYLLTDFKIIDALGDLKDAGKDVKVVLNKTFPPNGGSNTNAFTTLKARGVSVVYASPSYTFTHAKTVVIDSAKVLIMTMNLTQASTNREFVATDSDPGDVADCEKIFSADYAGTPVSVTGKLVVSPPAATPVDARGRLKALIDSATKSLDVEVQSLSDDTLTDAIITAHKQTVAVRVVISGGNEDTAGEKDSIAKMKAAGVPLKAVTTPYIHAKVVVVDGKKVFVGSHNFTVTGLTMNREIGVVADSTAEAAKVRAVIATDYAAGVTPP